MKRGIQLSSREGVMPGMYDVRGSDVEARPATKSETRCAGAIWCSPPMRRASSSNSCWNFSPASTPHWGSRWAKSSRRTSVTSPELAKGEVRPLGDMPLTTDCAASVMAGTMKPPGHMQKE